MAQPASARRATRELHARDQLKPGPAKSFLDSCPDVGEASDLYELSLFLTPDLNGNLQTLEADYWLQATGYTSVSERMDAINLLREMWSESRKATQKGVDG